MEKTSAQEAYARFRKTAQPVLYDAYGNPVEQKGFPVLPMLLGGGLGGAAAHMMPTERARILRELAEEITPEAAEAAKKGPRKWGPEGVKDWHKVKYQVKPTQVTSFKAPADVAKQFYKSKALGANAKRLLAGIALGSLGGYLAQKYME